MGIRFSPSHLFDLQNQERRLSWEFAGGEADVDECDRWPAVAIAAVPEPMNLSVAIGLVQSKHRRGKGIVSIQGEGEGEGFHGGDGERRGQVGDGDC